jgi:hypothetical protein
MILHDSGVRAIFRSQKRRDDENVMRRTVFGLTIVIVLQAVISATTYGLAAEDRFPRSQMAILYLPAAAAFATTALILWRAEWPPNTTGRRLIVTILGAALATLTGVSAALLYGLNRWGS